uniref:Uncharacterized protein n=1 Tax=Triticum urartu TaxID=4572 RepID=A0A8R7V1Q6_TRIUA
MHTQGSTLVPSPLSLLKSAMKTSPEAAPTLNNADSESDAATSAKQSSSSLTSHTGTVELARTSHRRMSPTIPAGPECDPAASKRLCPASQLSLVGGIAASTSAPNTSFLPISSTGDREFRSNATTALEFRRADSKLANSHCDAVSEAAVAAIDSTEEEGESGQYRASEAVAGASPGNRQSWTPGKSRAPARARAGDTATSESMVGSGVRTLVREASTASKLVTTPPCAATREAACGEGDMATAEGATRPVRGRRAVGRRERGEKVDAGEREARRRPSSEKCRASARRAAEGGGDARRPLRRKERMPANRRGSRSRKCGASAGEGPREARGEEAPARERVAAVVWKSSPPTLRVTTEVDAMGGDGEFS